MKRLEDNQEFMKGALAGSIAGIAMFIFIESFRWMGLIKFGQSYLAGDTVFTYQNNLGMNLIAFFITSGVGMFWGVIISFLFSKVFSGDHYLFKIIFISFCIFFFHLGFLDEPFHYDREIHERTVDLLVIMAGYLLYGIILAFVLKRFKIINQ
jgi:hypothetical protein